VPAIPPPIEVEISKDEARTLAANIEAAVDAVQAKAAVAAVVDKADLLTELKDKAAEVLEMNPAAASQLLVALKAEQPAHAISKLIATAVTVAGEAQAQGTDVASAEI
jgi:ABC-type amino acid transport substrate-binding protein